MGANCASISAKKVNRQTYKDLNSRHLKDILECFDYFRKVTLIKKIEEAKQEDSNFVIENPNEISIDFLDFEDIFSPILNTTEEFFNKLNINGKVIFSEAISIFAFFSRGLLDEKIVFLCHLYDSNHDGDLQKNEVLAFFQSIARAIWRVLLQGQVIIPSYAEIDKFIKEHFIQLTDAKSKYISFKELGDFIKNNDTIQDLLYLITEFQTFERAKKKYDYIMTKFMDVFYADPPLQFMDEKYSPTKSILKGCKSQFGSDLSDDLVDELRSLLDPMRKEVVSESDYLAVMKPLASFMATDVQGNGELDTSEVKTLIWLIEGIEPTDQRVANDVRMIDTDNNGTVDKLEWITYLGSSSESGVIDFSIKKSFDFYDKDKNGKIDLEELTFLLKDNILDPSLTAGKTLESIELIKGMIQALAHEIMKIIDKGKKGYVEWLDFKNNMTITKDKQDKLKKFIRDMN